MPQTDAHLPRWDVSQIYPSLDSPELERDLRALLTQLDDLTALFDRYGIGSGAAETQEPEVRGADTVAAFDDALRHLNETQDLLETLTYYIHTFVVTDTRDDAAQERQSELLQHSTALSDLRSRLVDWIAQLDVEWLIEHSTTAEAHAFWLRKTRRSAQHVMSPHEEALAAKLHLSGRAAWVKLHRDLSSQLEVTLDVDGEAKTLPIGQVRGLSSNPDRDVRRRAYEAEIEGWRTIALPLAAALNAAKGEAITVASRRSWETPLDATLFENSIDRDVFDAIMTEVRAAFPDFRRYLRAKATLLEVPALAWYDLYAPVGSATGEWTFGRAKDFIVEQFSSYSPALQGLAERAFDERWIDAEPRPGKRPGSQCLWLGRGESRILTSFANSHVGVTTLAHELGHAYHNVHKAKRTSLQRDDPFVLAESASIFCETIVRDVALRHATDDDRTTILEASLQGACLIVVGASSYYLFEERLFKQRATRELTTAEICRYMRDAQLETYGDAVSEDTLHQHMWAVLPHHYALDYYNFPYAFGLLFGLGLFARYQDDPYAFRDSYDDLLSMTGMAEPVELASRFGIDIRSPEFWRASLDVLRQDIDRFQALADESATLPTGSASS